MSTSLSTCHVVLGVRPWGSIPASGAYPPKDVPCTVACDELDHDAWNEHLVASIRQKALAAREAEGEAWTDIESVFSSLDY